ncbi:Protein kinase wis1 [Golovinomyces cichoracearum]|uniref:mitogen-activated protein kinase kinase n=1 Tax=Golovinomyces cichoracearum TaxID=62708 RepID=A0A420HEM1_9PEZI|nr:Protein kinase wis1 [Golovinomyces cichoracearum]
MVEPSDSSLSAIGESKDFETSPRSPGNENNEETTDLKSCPLESSHTVDPIPRTSSGIPNIVPASTRADFDNDTRKTSFPISNSSFRTGPSASSGSLPESVEAKMRAFHLSRQGTPTRPLMKMHSSQGPSLSGASNYHSSIIGGSPADLRLPVNQRPQPQNIASSPVMSTMAIKGSLGARRGMKLPGGLPGTSDSLGPLSNNVCDDSRPNQVQQAPSMFNKFSEFVDTKNGTLKFAGKAVIHGQGIDFTSGNNFSISLDEVDTLEELGRGNYGTVYKVRHARPRIRRPGLGLAGCRLSSQSSITSAAEKDSSSPEVSPRLNGSTGIIMAMKEIRLELDEAKFAAIIMELDILHRCNSPYIIDFYGAFFQEGAVYICIEYMDGGSIDKIYGDGIPENVLRKITFASVKGLKTLKDDHNIIHRDVKPTNILVNTRGQVKICDFGVSGNLVASIAKTNIGCQSYMAPERIAGGGMAQSGTNGGTYSVQSDVWSLGLTIIECALGKYPYPPETYNNIFSQLSAIVEGEPPGLPKDLFSPQIRDFVRGCLNKKPMLRPTYSMLLQHPWLAQLSKPITISEEDENPEADVDAKSSNIEETISVDKEVAEWVINALRKKKNGTLGGSLQQDLHAAQPSSVSPDIRISPG